MRRAEGALALACAVLIACGGTATIAEGATQQASVVQDVRYQAIEAHQDEDGTAITSFTFNGHPCLLAAESVGNSDHGRGTALALTCDWSPR